MQKLQRGAHSPSDAGPHRFAPQLGEGGGSVRVLISEIFLPANTPEARAQAERRAKDPGRPHAVAAVAGPGKLALGLAGVGNLFVNITAGKARVVAVVVAVVIGVFEPAREFVLV